MKAPPVLLLGQCGLERLVEPLRALLPVEVHLASWTQVDLAQRLNPSLIYIDLFGWDTVGPPIQEAIRGRSPTLDLAPLRGMVSALQPFPVVYRAPRRPPAGAFGLLGGGDPVLALFDAWGSLLTGQRTLDIAGLWARRGLIWDDIPFGLGHGEAGPQGARVEAEALAALWWARQRGPLKCAVVDLDDTLIHGELAADDFSTLNPAYTPEGEAPQGSPADAWWRLRRGLHEALRILASRGVLLALCTRNDPQMLRRRWRKRPLGVPGFGAYERWYKDLDPQARAQAADGFDRALDALALGPEDFVCIEAGFAPKSQMCRRIAERLGIGSDSLAFLDDSPYEREEVRRYAPELVVLDGPVDGFREQLLLGPWFTAWEPGKTQRLDSYRSRAAVVEATEAGVPPEQFLQELNISLRLRPAQAADLPRAQELLARSKQLNLTGARPALDQPEGVWVGSCRDRLADHGLIHVAVVREGELVAWACSCRVLPHRVAGSLLGALMRRVPGLRVQRIDTGRNGATLGLIEEAQGPPAPWVSLTLDL